MKYRYLGQSGLLVSRICLGTMTFGMEGWGCDERQALALTRRFIEGGGNFIDTADMYSHGVAEQMLGKAIAEHPREDLVIATKCWFRMRPAPNAKGLSRKHILAAADDSLRRLGVDYIDLYQLHGPDPFTPLEETLRAVDDLVRVGKVRYVGCSNFYAWQLVKANALADRLGYAKFISGQHLYNLLRRDVEREILPACDDQGMGLLCWSAIAGGLLTGKYDKNRGPAADSRVGLRAKIDLPRYWNDESFRVIDEVLAVAAECNVPPAQVALAWLLGDRRVASVIVGAKTPEQVADWLPAGDWDLPADHRRRLSEAVPFQHGYPHDWMATTWGNIAGQEEFFPWKATRRLEW
ncbi:MAG: aldo/keto reductase [Planctomycetales bacterium]|nr:aldo/keto reductase [Planctomycetales bacterium]